MEAYFDNSATTRCFEEVKDIVVKTMMEDFGNPSAMHQKGVDAEGYVKESADWGKIKTEVKDALGDFVWKETKRRQIGRAHV